MLSLTFQINEYYPSYHFQAMGEGGLITKSDIQIGGGGEYLREKLNRVFNGNWIVSDKAQMSLNDNTNDQVS